jgi:hypothetical protein
MNALKLDKGESSGQYRMHCYHDDKFNTEGMC